MAGWSIDQARDGDGGTKHLFTGSTILSGITAALDYCCVWRMCAWVSCSGCPSSHISHRDSSCIFITRPDLIFKALVRHSNQVQLSHKLLTMKNKKACYWLKTQRRKTRRNVIMTRNTQWTGMSNKQGCELIKQIIFFIQLMGIYVLSPDLFLLQNKCLVQPQCLHVCQYSFVCFFTVCVWVYVGLYSLACTVI